MCFYSSLKSKIEKILLPDMLSPPDTDVIEVVESKTTEKVCLHGCIDNNNCLSFAASGDNLTVCAFQI